MLPLKKIYIDSRDRTPDSKSASNFKIELPYTVQMPENTVFYVTDVCIPHVWNTIGTDFNDKLYMSYIVPGVNSQLTENYVIVTLAENDYTLTQFASELQTKMNGARLPSDVSKIAFVVTTNIRNNTITISLASTTNPDICFKLYTDAEVVKDIKDYWTTADPANLQSANDVITNVKPNVRNTTYTTGFVNLNHINNVYITSPNLGSFDTLATFSNNIIKKVPVTAGYGFMVVDQVMTTNDYLDCSRQTLRTLEFHLRDGRGREINLNGMYVTFSLVFNKYNLEM